MVTELVNEGKNRDLRPSEPSIPGQKCSFACSSLQLELLANTTHSHDNTDGTFLGVRRCEHRSVVRVHL